MMNITNDGELNKDFDTGIISQRSEKQKREE